MGTELLQSNAHSFLLPYSFEVHGARISLFIPSITTAQTHKTENDPPSTTVQ
eukprot:m.49281 g.49281  ORF g.49281 m.49281 type:complete len:52 (-) comp16066_c1_seq2:45-200(-)